MCGVMRYANLQRRWVLHEEMRHVVSGNLTGWRPCDGAVLAGVHAKLLDVVREVCPHIVFCSGSANPHNLPVVCLDDRAAGVMAGEHLIECRLESFAFHGVVLSDNAVGAKRFAGLQEAVGRCGFTAVASGMHSARGGPQPHRAALIEWLLQLPKPVGILGYDDGFAHDLAGACLEAELSVPDQVAIIGVNNDDLLCDSAWPPITSIDGDFGRCGFLAAKMLDRLMNGETLEPAERLIQLPPIGVVRRQSTDVLVIDQPEVVAAVRYIREHACDPCSVDDVLQHIHVGRRWLERQFTQRLGHSPHEEIIRIRMETARKLLHQSEISVAEAAFRCGFSDTANFSRSFQQAVGVTPAAFRRKTV